MDPKGFRKKKSHSEVQQSEHTQKEDVDNLVVNY